MRSRSAVLLATLLAACGEKEQAEPIQDGGEEDDTEDPSSGTDSAEPLDEDESNCIDGIDNDGDGALDCEDEDCDDSGRCDEVCDDGRDNDNDGATDCDDRDCYGPGCPEECDDNRDNDGDGAIDCADTDCPDLCPEDCDNGVDDDEDGATDCDDTDCDGSCPEDCTDGRDNDGDGALDCDDTDCDGTGLCPEACADGRDNDGDGLLDCEDGDCLDGGVCIEVCDDGDDQDEDGLTDCADDDCFGESACEGTTVWVRGGQASGYFGKVKYFDRGTTPSGGTSTLFHTTRFYLTWSFADVSGAVRIQSGTLSQTCGWSLGGVRFSDVHWGWDTYAHLTLERVSSAALTSTGSCGIAAGDLASRLAPGHRGSATETWGRLGSDDVLGWYPVRLPRVGTSWLSTTYQPVSDLWIKRERATTSTTFGPGAPHTIP